MCFSHLFFHFLFSQFPVVPSSIQDCADVAEDERALGSGPHFPGDASHRRCTGAEDHVRGVFAPAVGQTIRSADWPLQGLQPARGSIRGGKRAEKTKKLK